MKRKCCMVLKMYRNEKKTVLVGLLNSFLRKDIKKKEKNCWADLYQWISRECVYAWTLSFNI